MQRYTPQMHLLELRGSLAHLHAAWVTIVTCWSVWADRYHTRRQLQELWQQDPNRLCNDLGLNPGAVNAECRKWFWQP